MAILDNLNPEQRAAVEHDAGPLLVVAGAGTGKTQVITRRIAHLIEQARVKPGQILALTFTEKAAREMEERLYELIGWESFQVPVLTFHAFGAELLGRFATHIGRSIRGGLINDTQKTLLLQQHFPEISLRYYGPQANLYEFLEGVVGYIGLLQNAGVSSKDYGDYVDGLRAEPGDLHPLEVAEQGDLAALYGLYEAVKAQTGVYDYHDQLELPLQILRERPNLAQRLAAEYRYVLVDEYQDTNSVQDELLRMFVGAEGNMFAVGDDDQAIYGFRGADISNILGFADHYKIADPAVLVQNYRSGQAVLDAAYRLIQHNNPERLESKLGISKRLLGQHDESRVEFTPYASPADEQEAVADDIARRLARGEPAASMAVLAPTHAPLKALARAMARRSIPYAIASSVSIFEQPELLALWYVLKWIGWQADDNMIAHIVLGPFGGWTAAEYAELLEVSRRDLVGIEEVIYRRETQRTTALADKLDEWRAWAKEVPVSQLGFRLVFDTGLAERWQRAGEDSPRMTRVFEDLRRLLEQMQDFETVAMVGDLGSYLRAFPQPPALEVTEPLGDAEGVQLLTVHAAKGLEFDTVYLVQCTQRSWSGSRRLGRVVPTGLVREQVLPPDHEFRRLMYVAVTRAKRTLLMSAAVSTAGGSKQMVTPFIAEMLGGGYRLPEVTPSVAGPGESELMSKLQRFYPIEHHFDRERLPFETVDGWLELSVTALGGYDFCPFEFYLQDVLKITQPMGPQLGFGSALHKVFEIYYKGTMAGTVPEAADLSNVLNSAWSSRGYATATEAEQDRLLAQETLKRFYARERGLNRTVVGSEVPVRFELPEAKLRLRGKIDALFGHGDGYEIRDFKTGRTKTSAEKLTKQAKENFQLRSYALAGSQLRGAPPAAVVLDYVVTGVEGEAVLSETILRNHHDKLCAMAERIRRRDFAPNPSALHQCAAIRYYGTGELDELTLQLQAGGGS
ncbi:MAG TPA: ATP-dependent DNA helicase [Candidatus Saccharimonadia bacterium]|nr:ATP-dependent DNA helicase [Candidatus Saccharimonadia bacterium]